MRYLVTGGAGFVGSSLAIRLKRDHADSEVISLDNLRRRGSELNIQRLTDNGVKFLHGDIRNKEDLLALGSVDSVIECSAEPSVLAGYQSSPDYVINTNLVGTINCLELARMCNATFVMLSSSRVYPYKMINNLNYFETQNRFEFSNDQDVIGCGNEGIAENFPLTGVRSLYGATKLASELLIQEYVEMYGIKAVINRCGVLTGPWQFGKVDQGVAVLWIAKHFWKQGLNYIGFGGEGKQVRDILHIDDLYRLILIQLNNIEKLNGEIFNVGGGKDVSVSLIELTRLCQKYTSNRIPIGQIKNNRPADIRIYLTDNTKITKATGWIPEIMTEQIIEDTVKWVMKHEEQLKGILR